MNNTSAANLGMETVPLEWYGGNPGTLADSINRMFSPEYNTTWGTFASTKWDAERKSAKNGKMDNKNANGNTEGEEEGEDGKGYLSLEYIHNNVHVSAATPITTNFYMGPILIVSEHLRWR